MSRLRLYLTPQSVIATRTETSQPEHAQDYGKHAEQQPMLRFQVADFSGGEVQTPIQVVPHRPISIRNAGGTNVGHPQLVRNAAFWG